MAFRYLVWVTQSYDYSQLGSARSKVSGPGQAPSPFLSTAVVSLFALRLPASSGFLLADKSDGFP